MLDACDDLYVDCGIDNLLHKALITISSDNRVEIHDLLQEMAKEIVREESREDPATRSRLNDAKEIQYVLNNSMGTGAIEVITLNTNELENDLYLSADTFQRMSNLRFLNIKPHQKKVGFHSRRNYTVHLLDGLNSLSNNLRYFCWESYPLESLPLGFSPKKLVEIHMQCSKVVKLWDGVQDLMNLKKLDLCGSKDLKELPDFTMAQNLEIVYLSCCENLWSIHPSMLSLPKLVSLDLSMCCRLKNLHGHNHMKSLKHLKLTICGALEEFMLSSQQMRRFHLIRTGIKTMKLPIGWYSKLEELYLGLPLRRFKINEISCLTSLKIFSVSDFREGFDKSKLVIMFDAGRSLEELHLMYCEVTEIPDNISNLSLLKILSLRACKVESLPNCIKHLSKLKLIDLGECKSLRSLPELPPSITHFYVNECASLSNAFGWGLADVMDFKVMQAIYNNNSCEVKFCYPGSTIPKGFKYSQTTERSITIDLALTYSDHLLGFASCCILPPFYLNTFAGLIKRKFHFDDEEVDYKDEREFPQFRKLSTFNVFVWYDPMECILKGTQRRRYYEATTYKFACEFFIESFGHQNIQYDDLIQGCGIWPIYASELKETVQQMELKLEKGTVAKNSSGPSENPNE